MRKIALVVLSIFLLGTSPAFSQLKFGLRGGINDNVRLREIVTDDYKIDYKLGSFGFHFGVTSQIKLFGLFVQPELLFSSNTNSIRVEDITSGKWDTGKQTCNKLDVPILFGAKFSKIKLMAGPVFTANVSSKSDLLDKNEIDYLYNSATVGYQMGIGLEGDKVGIELRYEGALSQYGTSMKIGSKSFDTDNRNNQLILSLCYYLGDK